MSRFHEQSGYAWWRIGTFVLAFALAATASWSLGVRLVTLSGAVANGTGVGVPRHVREWQEEMRADPSRERVAMVGDSILMTYPGTPSLSDRLEPWLRWPPPGFTPARVHTLTIPAWNPISEYCLADEIVKGKPELIALEINVRSLEPQPLGALGFPETAGWIEPNRALEAAFMPLSDAGITLNRLLYYQLLVGLRLEQPWARLVDLQARLINSRGPFESVVEEYVGGSTTARASLIVGFTELRRLVYEPTPGKTRSRRAYLEQRFDGPLDGLEPSSPRLVVIGALLRRFRDAGIRTLVWVSPVNMDQLAILGLPRDGLEHSLGSLRQVVEANGGRFADFHSLLTDPFFRDSGDHFTLDGQQNGAARLAPALARSILAMLPRAPVAPTLDELRQRAVR